MTAIAFVASAAVGCVSDKASAHPVPIVDQFSLSFSPVYSAYDGVHDSRVLVAPVARVDVERWEIVDSNGFPRNDVADMTPDPTFGGVTLKVRRAGDYVVLAHAGDKSGCSELHITAGDADQWAIGESRYNQAFIPTKTPARAQDYRVPPEFSCKSCHGDGTGYLAPEYSPEQSAGFSDDELVGMWMDGTRPSDESDAPHVLCSRFRLDRSDRLAKPIFAWFHAASFTAEESAGLLLYLRSLPFRSEGSLDLGGILPLAFYRDAGSAL